MTPSSPDRRFEPRSPASVRAVVLGPGVEQACLITDRSGGGLKIRMDRAVALPRQVTVVDIAAGAAIEAEVRWTKGMEAGLRTTGGGSLRGLVPARLAAARAAYVRAGGR